MATKDPLTKPSFLKNLSLVSGFSLAWNRVAKECHQDLPESWDKFPEKRARLLIHRSLRSAKIDHRRPFSQWGASAPDGAVAPYHLSGATTENATQFLPIDGKCYWKPILRLDVVIKRTKWYYTTEQKNISQPRVEDSKTISGQDRIDSSSSKFKRQQHMLRLKAPWKGGTACEATHVGIRRKRKRNYPFSIIGLGATTTANSITANLHWSDWASSAACRLSERLVSDLGTFDSCANILQENLPS